MIWQNDEELRFTHLKEYLPPNFSSLLATYLCMPSKVKAKAQTGF
jgi:hypothetical protein